MYYTGAIKVSFYLNGNATARPIRCRVSKKYDKWQSFTFATGHTLIPSKWSKARKRVKGIDPLNEELDNLEVEIRNVDRVISMKEGKKDYPFAHLRNHFIGTIGSEKGTLARTVKEGIDRYWREKKSSSAKSTLRKMKAQFEGFEMDFLGRNVRWADITKEFMQDFWDYMAEGGVNKANLSLKTVNRYASEFMSFLNFAAKNGWIEKVPDFKNPPDNHKDDFYLTKEEIDMLLELDSLTKEEEVVRDAYVFSWYTGARHSDVNEMQESTIVYDKKNDIWVWKYISRKTRRPVKIGLFGPAYDIIRKYNNKIPYTTNQKVNKLIKRIGMYAGLNEEVTLIKHLARGPVEIKAKKYELMHYHQSRTGFITYMVNQGVSIDLVSQLAGVSRQHIERTYYRPSYEDILREQRRAATLHSEEG